MDRYVFIGGRNFGKGVVYSFSPPYGTIITGGSMERLGGLLQDAIADQYEPVLVTTEMENMLSMRAISPDEFEEVVRLVNEAFTRIYYLKGDGILDQWEKCLPYADRADIHDEGIVDSSFLDEHGGCYAILEPASGGSDDEIPQARRGHIRSLGDGIYAVGSFAISDSDRIKVFSNRADIYSNNPGEYAPPVITGKVSL